MFNTNGMASAGARVLKDCIIKRIGVLSSKERIVCSGALFYAKTTKRFLLLQKATGKHQGTWSLVGGTAEDQETPWQGLQREIAEEIGQMPKIIKTVPIETFVSNDEHFHFHTYLCVIDKEFIPSLNNEHDGYAWVSFSKWPKPLHTGLSNTLRSKTNQQKLETVFKLIDIISQ
jgi:ADP-ribose pyrophosphatase YjhB (NUDIX family)